MDGFKKVIWLAFPFKGAFLLQSENRLEEDKEKDL